MRALTRHARPAQDRFPPLSSRSGFALAGLGGREPRVRVRRGHAVWMLGGTLLLDTVGGAPEDLARERSLGSFAFGTGVVVLKVTAGLLVLALLGRGAGRLRRLGLLIANGVASAILLLWGGASVLLSGLVLGGVITPDGSVDERSLRWHVPFWDLWFVVWGVLIAVAVVRNRRRAS